MTCINCQNPIQQGEKFCGKCGSSVIALANHVQDVNQRLSKLEIVLVILIFSFSVLLLYSLGGALYTDYYNYRTEGWPIKIEWGFTQYCVLVSSIALFIGGILAFRLKASAHKLITGGAIGFFILGLSSLIKTISASDRYYEWAPAYARLWSILFSALFLAFWIMIIIIFNRKKFKLKLK